MGEVNEQDRLMGMREPLNTFVFPPCSRPPLSCDSLRLTPGTKCHKPPRDIRPANGLLLHIASTRRANHRCFENDGRPPFASNAGTACSRTWIRWAED